MGQKSLFGASRFLQPSARSPPSSQTPHIKMLLTSFAVSTWYMSDMSSWIFMTTKKTLFSSLKQFMKLFCFAANEWVERRIVSCKKKATMSNSVYYFRQHASHTVNYENVARREQRKLCLISEKENEWVDVEFETISPLLNSLFRGFHGFSSSSEERKCFNQRKKHD